jgi:hypothetical protein
MKKHVQRKRQQRTADEMRAEYRFDYAKAKPNRFASRMKAEAIAVILDPDVASVFRSSDAVNTFLRSVIATMPEREQKRVKTA